LADGSVDLVSMASSFHWADFDTACDEFHRILRSGGVFVALWNPRLIEVNSYSRPHTAIETTCLTRAWAASTQIGILVLLQTASIRTTTNLGYEKPAPDESARISRAAHGREAHAGGTPAVVRDFESQNTIV
jgi:ubiquinone/menaquinone biosynthesis C-methylase UbiE